MTRLDALDARLLLALEVDPDATALSLSRSLGIARNTVHARLRRMTETGALRGSSLRVDPAALGYPLVAFVSIALSQSDGSFSVAGLRGIPEVVEIHSTTGEADLLVKVVARDTADLLRITTGMLGVRGVTRTNTTVSLVETMPLRLTALLDRAARPDG
ncbi:Lrp/AsnC family transcriptional regulator [Nakamurella flavida]|uniref:Lrp/AsnC family transcriptional regulator n=1 Tax=Nakamurella flavida TaxID=363630 RepID=A0A938YCN7_9ACTN|nr:Lrp/AsnC family transcriptional regulator [Nakamurella flavida]MBM9475220.1 Lrp/AsnC family transcriptional regulator [Nakamurella flavida]MDP9776793.1 DNA-binding Lrp family transcriptional regulator [Nakamurella flavida]